MTGLRYPTCRIAGEANSRMGLFVCSTELYDAYHRSGFLVSFHTIRGALEIALSTEVWFPKRLSVILPTRVFDLASIARVSGVSETDWRPPGLLAPCPARIGGSVPGSAGAFVCSGRQLRFLSVFAVRAGRPTVRRPRGYIDHGSTCVAAARRTAFSH